MAAPTIPPALPPEFGVYFALLEVGSLVQHGVQAQLRDEGGLSFVQFQILAILGEEPAASRSMTDLADRLVHSRSGLTYQVGRLEKAGLVARGPSTRDERGVDVTLTPAGASLLERVVPGHVAVVRDILLDALGDAERDDLARLLARLAERMRSRPPRSARR